MGSHKLSSCSLLLLFLTFVRADFKWIDDKTNPNYNCAGKVADAVCCKDNFCDAARSESDCKSGNKQFLCAWSNGKCTSFRDDKNNVCCQSEVKDACDKVVRGICPADWQVPENCCSPLGRKWNGTLVGVKPGFVCCNAPCTEMQKAGCPLPNSCAPSQRSLSIMPPMAAPRYMGFNIYPPVQVPIGNILSGTGMGGDYGSVLLSALGDGKSKTPQVDEITVDDLMTMLIESLSADKDAMVYDSEINSDPWLGKLKSGGPLTNLNLPDPNIFLNQIYGNPFGMSQGNLGNYPSLPPGYPPSLMGYPAPPYSPYGGYPPQMQYPYTPPPQYQYPPQPQQYVPPPQYLTQQYTAQPQYPQPQYPQPPQYQAPQYPQQQYQAPPPQAPMYQTPPQYSPPQQYQAPPPQALQYQPPAQQQYQAPPQAPQYQPPPPQQTQQYQAQQGPVYQTKP